MSRAIQDVTACREALARLPELDLGGLRQQWRTLYKAEASPHLRRELLVRRFANGSTLTREWARSAVNRHGSGSHLTRCWREMDSNFRFRCVRRS